MEVKSLPRNIFASSAASLKQLDLSYLSLPYLELPEWFDEKPADKLTILDADGNLFRRLRSEDFELIPNVEQLDVGNNAISDIEPETFKPLAKLQTLNIENNRLTRLDKDLLKNDKPFEDLEQIDLRGNALAFLHPDTFDSVPNLRRLDLRGYQGTDLDINAFRSEGELMSLDSIDLSDSNLSPERRQIIAHLLDAALEAVDINVDVIVHV